MRYRKIPEEEEEEEEEDGRRRRRMMMMVNNNNGSKNSCCVPLFVWNSWTYGHFQKDKLRFRERYIRSLELTTTTTTNSNINNKLRSKSTICPSFHRIQWIPDGVFLRTYLKLLEQLLCANWNTTTTHNNENDNDNTNGFFYDWELILLESVAEWMEYRHSSFVIVNNNNNNNKLTTTTTTTTTNSSCHKKRTEQATMQERLRIIQLAQTYTNNTTTTTEVPVVTVQPFPDLSYRSIKDYDEMEVMQYSTMSMEHRSRCAILRAANLLLLPTTPLPNNNNNNNKNNNNSSTHTIWILTHDPILLSQYPSNTTTATTNNNNSICAMTCVQFLQSLQQRSKENVETTTWDLIRQSCEEEYNNRNTTSNDDDDDDDDKIKNYRGHVPYLSETDIRSSSSNVRYVCGTLKVSKQNVRQGHVQIITNNNNNVIRYYINDDYFHQHFNRCIHNDIVILQPLPSHLWESPLTSSRYLFNNNNNNNNNNNKEDVGTKEKENHSKEEVVVPTARVVALKQSSRRQYVATWLTTTTNNNDVVVAVASSSSSNNHNHNNKMWVVPMDSRIPKIKLNNHSHSNYKNQRLWIQIDGWKMNSYYPYGHLIRTIGPVGDLETEMECLLLEHGIQNRPFSPNALACLPILSNNNETWTIPIEEIHQRNDLRQSRLIFSVDPPGCQDIDDAMHAHRLPNGDVEIGVHIADVTYFLPKGSALDKEACDRATTFYFVDRRFDMLPSLLSSDLCSLHGHMDRLAVSYILTMSSDFKEIKSSWYGRTIIHNFQAMTYDQAHNILHDKNPDDDKSPIPPPLTAGGRVDHQRIPQLKHDLSILTRLARKLRNDRETIGGAVDLSSGGGGDRGTELKFTLDDDGNPMTVSSKKEMEIHNTIAELMILANGHVARTIHKRFPESSLLRIHRAVGAEKFGELQNLLKVGGMTFDGKTNKALANTLKSSKQVGSSAHGSVIDSVVQSMATRAMSEAQYICTGMRTDDVDLSHYGLGIEKYTHFTSPIRRYADVVVHRLLLATLTAPSPNIYKFQQMSITNPLSSLPDSQTMSVLTGEGRRTQNNSHNLPSETELDDGTANSFVQDFSTVSSGIENDIQTQEPQNYDTKKLDLGPYQPNETAKICENLNRQNRMAKLSSMECQHLFLSLYLRNNVDIAPAVILSLRQNGMIVYVPKFDMKGPVFLCDRNNNLQIKPQIIGLPTNSGLPPSSAFTALDGCRRFPEGKCILHDDGDEAKHYIELNVPDSRQKSQATFKILDVVTVQLSSDLSETTARIPRPRLQLYSLEQNDIKVGSKKSNEVIQIDSSMVKQTQQNCLADLNDKENESFNAKKLANSSFTKVINSFKITPELVGVSLRMNSKEKRVNITGRTQAIPGRLVFGDFKNPDTNMGVQETAYNAAAEARTAGSTQSDAQYADYDSSRRIEREATARTQRLAAGKRNTRRAKAGK